MDAAGPPTHRLLRGGRAARDGVRRAAQARVGYERAVAGAPQPGCTGEGDEPFFDFEHKDGRASGHPIELYWAGEDPKKGGIRARGKWTGSGKAALVARDFTRFSPQWDFDEETDEPTGVGANLGGLVNRAAFTRIQALAKTGRNESTGEIEMTREEFKSWLGEELKPVTDKLNALEAKASAAETAARAGTATATAAAPADDKIILLVQTAMKPVTDKLADIEKQAGENRTAQAKAAVQSHINRGAIGPEDKDSINFWTESVLKDPDKAAKAMAKLPGRRFNPLAPNASAATGTAAGADHDIIEGARAMAKAAPDRFKSEPDAIAAFATTQRGDAAYKAYRESLLAGHSGMPTVSVNK